MNETTALIITLNIMIHSGAILLKIPPTQLFFFVGLLFFYLPPPACLKRPTPLLYA